MTTAGKVTAFANTGHPGQEWYITTEDAYKLLALIESAKSVVGTTSETNVEHLRRHLAALEAK